MRQVGVLTLRPWGRLLRQTQRSREGTFWSRVWLAYRYDEKGQRVGTQRPTSYSHVPVIQHAILIYFGGS